jgi:hypothetical protein
LRQDFGRTNGVKRGKNRFPVITEFYYGRTGIHKPFLKQDRRRVNPVIDSNIVLFLKRKEKSIV